MFFNPRRGRRGPGAKAPRVARPRLSTCAAPPFLALMASWTLLALVVLGVQL